MVGTPIVVATPSRAWREIRDDLCPASRRGDLIYFGNGLPLDIDNNDDEAGTWVVPHFGVLQVDGPIVSSDTSPPTYVQGRHATFVAHALQRHGLTVVPLDSPQALRVHAVRKLLWASCLWLVCHANRDDEPLTVSQVHEQPSAAARLQALVHELWPAVLETMQASTNDKDETTITDDSLYSLPDTLAYMKQYSLSMPGAIPSRDLALAELADRNGVLYRSGNHQPLHQDLLWQQIRPQYQDDEEQADKQAVLQRLLWSPPQSSATGRLGKQ